VLGASSTLIDYGKGMTQAVRDDLLLSIREEAERLNRYVGNLLDMTRLEGGALRLRTDWTDVRDVLGAAADRVSRRLETRALTRDFPVELSLVRSTPACWSRPSSTSWRTPSPTARRAPGSRWPPMRIAPTW
jgi:two-component system sensor histidine kinase KdpD